MPPIEPVTQREVDQRFEAIRELVAAQLHDLSRRVDGTNEIRLQLGDQALRYATKEQVDALDKLVQELRVTGGSAAGRAPFIDAITKLFIGVAVGYAVAHFTKGG